LPFSDTCPPLAVEPQAQSALLEGLISNTGARCEMRGVAAPEPWQKVGCFQLWSLDLARPAAEIERSVAGVLRRKVRRARELGVEISHGSNMDYVRRYYALHAATRHRQGIPTQPRRLFTALQETFSPDGSLGIWLATHQGTDVAGGVLLREGDQLYYKWGARRLTGPGTANHLLMWEVICEYAGKVRICDLGRTDVSNQGLEQFKKELGGRSEALPYSFFPRAPQQISSESLTGMRKTLSRVWTRLPAGAATTLGGWLYPYLG
jgi:Acetyltransferase (GNAT) domain